MVAARDAFGLCDDPGEVRWIYRFGADIIEARVWCADGQAASFLELRDDRRVAAASFCSPTNSCWERPSSSSAGEVEIFSEGPGWPAEPGGDSLMAAAYARGTCFAIAGGAGPRRRDWRSLTVCSTLQRRRARNGPYVALRSPRRSRAAG
jgi:hypothetical protein